jgi:hypothetical protein
MLEDELGVRVECTASTAEVTEVAAGMHRRAGEVG